MRDHDAAGQGAGADRVEHAATSTARSVGAPHKVYADATSSTTTGHLPIGPSCCVADVTPSGARDLLEHAERLRHAARRQDVLDEVDGLERSAAEPDPRHLLRGLRASTARRRTTTRPGRGAHVGARRQAGAPPVHALGRARLGQLRPGAADRHPRAASTRTASSSRSSSRGFGIPYYIDARRRSSRSRGDGACSPAPARSTRRSAARSTTSRTAVIGKTLPLQNNYFKTSALRAPDAPQTAFAAEQLIDELAYAAKMDPVAFRLQEHRATLTRRSVAALEERARRASRRPRTGSRGWPRRTSRARTSSPAAASRSGTTRTRRRRGVADIEVNKKTGKIVVKHVYVARSTPASSSTRTGCENNEEGAVDPGRQPRAARAGRVRQEAASRASTGSRYPILRFKDAPKITLDGAPRTDVPRRHDVAAGGSRSTGSGEPALVAGAGGDRERVLRRHGRPHPRGADDAGPRPRRARSRRQVAGGIIRANGDGPGDGPVLVQTRSPTSRCRAEVRRGVVVLRYAARASAVPLAAGDSSTRYRRQEEDGWRAS